MIHLDWQTPFLQWEEHTMCTWQCGMLRVNGAMGFVSAQDCVIWAEMQSESFLTPKYSVTL